MAETIALSLEEIEQLAVHALLRENFSAPQAHAIARTVTAAERDGCRSHGLFRIPFYIKALQNDNTNPEAVPVLSDAGKSVLHIDAGCGFCPLALETGYEPLINRARTQGIAALAIHNVYNIAALWPEVEQLAESGLVAMAFTAATATVAPAGGTRPVFGTNPMAFSWPRSGKPPLVFDQASSASARGEIQLHLNAGKAIPEGWAVDAQGNPTTDPQAALDGAQLAFGGHKGAALALMVELLAGALLGDLLSFQASEHDQYRVGAPFGGELILAIEPTHFAPSVTEPGGNRKPQLDHAEQLFERILMQHGTRLPSDRRYEARQASMQQGVLIDKSLYDALIT